jgi:hypothetical protein
VRVERVPWPLRFSFGCFLCVFLVLWFFSSLETSDSRGCGLEFRPTGKEPHQPFQVLRRCREREFAYEERVGDFLFIEATVGTENSEGHGQIEAGALFANVGGREINGDVGGRNIAAAVFERGANAIAALAHGGVGQADGVEVILVRFYAGDVDFDFDDVGVNAVNGSAQSFIEHRGLGAHERASADGRSLGRS